MRQENRQSSLFSQLEKIFKTSKKLVKFSNLVTSPYPIMLLD